MPVIRAKDLIKLLGILGYQIDHIQGSHHILRRSDGKKITVPVHGNREIPTGTLHGILFDAGVSRDEFLQLLLGNG